VKAIEESYDNNNNDNEEQPNKKRGERERAMTRRDRVSALFAGGDFFVIFEYFFGLAFSALLPLLDATNQPTN
jgi:hypothetical protein